MARPASAYQRAVVSAKSDITQTAVAELSLTSEMTDVKSKQIRILFTVIPSPLFTILICSLASAPRLNQTIGESLELRHQYELAGQTIRYQAQYDDLANLPDRHLLLATLHRKIARADRHHRYRVVFFITPDRFKTGNDPDSTASHASIIADDIRKRPTHPFMIQGHEIHQTISIGIATDLA